MDNYWTILSLFPKLIVQSVFVHTRQGRVMADKVGVYIDSSMLFRGAFRIFRVRFCFFVYFYRAQIFK